MIKGLPKLKWIGILSIILISYSTSGQNTENDALENIVNEFSKGLSELYAQGGRAGVSKFLSDDFTFTSVFHTISGGISVVQGGSDDFLTQIERISNDLQISYGAPELSKIVIGEGLSSIVYNIEYETKRQLETLGKGTEANIISARKYRGNWKIVYLQSTNVLESLQKGVCNCEILSGKTANFVSKTRVPFGSRYESRLNEFEFRETGSGEKAIKVGGHTYRWQLNNELRKDNIGQDGRLLGVANTEQDVISLILSKELYSEHCANLRFIN